MSFRHGRGIEPPAVGDPPSLPSIALFLPMTILRILLIALGLCAAARGTTVIPPSFDELVSSSELIFRGRVVAVVAQTVGEGKRQRIATRVTFAVERRLRGEIDETLVLEFLGGQVGEKSFVLSGWPTFTTGDRGVFFVENRLGRICPLVRLRHGRYRIEAGTASSPERVSRDDFTPLRTTADIVAPLAEARKSSHAALAGPAMTLAEFETHVAERSAAMPRPQSAIR